MFGGIGAPEFLVVGILILLIYPLIMTIDAVRRPPAQYQRGTKSFWVTALVLSNPIAASLIPAPHVVRSAMGLVSLLTFMPIAIAYHVQNRWRRPIQKTATP